MTIATTALRALVVASATVGLAGGALAGMSGSASAATTAPADFRHLGGINTQDACYRQYPGQDRKAIVLDRNDALSWRCRYTPSGPGIRPHYVLDGGINANAECVVMYGQGAWARAANPNDALSWYCFRGR